MSDKTAIYVLECSSPCGETYVKIGVAADPYARITTVLCGCPFPVRRVRYVDMFTRRRALQVERAFHLFLSKWHQRGEWFAVKCDDADDFELHLSALLNMEVGAGAWGWVEVDWSGYEAAKASRRAYALTSGKVRKWYAHRQLAQEMGRYRAGN